MTLAAQLIGGSMLLISAAWIAWEIHIAPVMDDETGTGLDTYVPPLAAKRAAGGAGSVHDAGGSRVEQ